jgi:hypothetical protein
VFVSRLVREWLNTADTAGHWGDYLRGLYVEAGNIAGMKHTADYKRGIVDSADITAVPLRHLFIFIRLITGAYIRDYVIGRFLKSREELVIKSPVCRELILDSKVH